MRRNVLKTAVRRIVSVGILLIFAVCNAEACDAKYVMM